MATFKKTVKSSNRTEVLNETKRNFGQKDVNRECSFKEAKEEQKGTTRRFQDLNKIDGNDEAEQQQKNKNKEVLQEEGVKLQGRKTESSNVINN